MPDGRARWPSTESVAKVLDATGASLEAFTALVSGARALASNGAARNAGRRIPLIGFAQAGGDGFFDDGGYPVGGGWDEVTLPEIGDPNAYALEISGDSMEPVFRDGDMVIVSPAAPIRRGDRVVVRTQRGEVMTKQLARRSARRIELRSLNPAHPNYSFDLPRSPGCTASSGRASSRGARHFALTSPPGGFGPPHDASATWRASAMRPVVWLFAACLALAPAGARRRQRRSDARPGHRRLAQHRRFGVQAGEGGLCRRLHSRQVIDAIQGGSVGAIAVAYVEFASSFEVRTVLDWSVIRDQASAQAFADKLVAAPRSFWGRTAISSGIDRAVQLLAESGFETPRRVIDVCGDGTNNAGRDVTESRDDAVKAGITINGLAIINDHPVSWTYAHVQPPGGLPNYYRENVTGGPSSFVLEVHDFHTFGEAMTRKLVTEIAERGAPRHLAATP